MEDRETQKQRVIDELREFGVVDNFWAIHNYILRLGAIIHGLRKEGWLFNGMFGEGKNKKNYYYYLVEEPKPKQFSLWMKRKKG